MNLEKAINHGGHGGHGEHGEHGEIRGHDRILLLPVPPVSPVVKKDFSV
jgi:hypothetical protein